MTDSQYENMREKMKKFRYFPLDGRKEMGDRFLQPWLYCHVYASGRGGKGEMKRVYKELKRFFEQKELQYFRKEAGSDGERIIEEEIFDSANVYLTICRDDDGFGRKLFGLLRMKPDEKEDKIIRDVYKGIIPLLARVNDFAERLTMMRAIDLACRSLYPQRLGDMKALIDSIEDAELRAVFCDFEIPAEEAVES